MNIEITSLEEKDFQQYKNLRLEALQDFPSAFGGTYEFESQLSDDEWKKRISRDNQIKLFAEYKGEVIGMTVCVFQPNSRSFHVANIYSVYVKPKFRGKGIARKLMQSILVSVKKNKDIQKINISVNAKNEEAITFYKSIGFQQSGILKKEICVDEIYYDEILMELFLENIL